jgi:hypothetical protein
VTPNLLAAMAARLAAGADAVQVDYVVANPEASRTAALRFAGFALVNSVAPLGKDALGISAGLYGTGMAFGPRALAVAGAWRSFGVAEDAEQHLRLVEAGLRVRFAPEAQVRSAMPTTTAPAAEQELRWETGRAELLRTWTGPLLRRWASTRDARTLGVVLGMLVPPQTLLLGAHAGLLALSARARARAGVAAALAGLLAQAVYVLGGLALVRAPAAVFRALAIAPWLVVRKAGVYARLAAGRGASTWVRTEREAL